jgi:hypothetical protein
MMTNERDGGSPTAEELLLGRVVGREDSESDWAALERLAAGDRTLWGRLARTLRDDQRLRAAVAGEVSTADSVTLPPSAAHRRPSAWWGSAGWLAAAVIACLWLADARDEGRRPDRSAIPPTAAAVGELPRFGVQAKPMPDGKGFEVLYVRPVVERAVVDRVFQVAADEYGLPKPLPVSPATLTSAASF